VAHAKSWGYRDNYCLMMEIPQILEELAYDLGDLPREAIEAAIVKKSALIPYLLATLEEAIAHIDDVIQDDNYQGHLYAMYLLAQFREKKAFPLVLRLFSLPGDVPAQIAGDVLTEDLSRILASVCDSDIAPIKELIENQTVNEYVRSAGLHALVTLVGCGLRPRKEILSYFQELMTYKLEKIPSFVWDSLIACCADLYPEEIIDEIKTVYLQGFIDNSFISLDDIQDVLTKNKDNHLFKLFSHAELIEDTISEMEKWLSPKDSAFPI
jgi:hypothetical protein